MDTAETLRALISEPPSLPIWRTPPSATTDAVDPLPPDPQPSGQAHAGGGRAGAWYALHLRAQALRLVGAGDALIAPGLLGERIEPHPYQLHVVRQVLHEKRPAAILADEVGLGKTIEAGLILKELLVRDLARSALIIAPKALLPQWQEELRERFDEDFVLTDEKRFRGFASEERLICSFQQFVRAFDHIQARAWDCLIVDEAHLLANPDSKRRRRAAELRARWRLLLTATPIQNKITDLYSLVDLARPGRLGTLRQFIAEFAADPATCRAVIPAKAEHLRAVAHEVMCRTHRAETGIAFAPRTVETYRIQAGPEEEAINRDVTSYLRALYRRGIALAGALNPPSSGSTSGAAKHGARTAPRSAQPPNSLLPPGEPAHTVNRAALIREIIALQQSLSSSPRAIAASLRARAERHPDERATLMDLVTRCERTPSAKEQLLLDTLQPLGAEPVLIFTLRLETARRLREVLAAHGRSAECYVGELSGDQRRALVQRFNRGDLGALIATDAGAEGLNLQERCRVVFNYDLHWNPMKMEQRIGRVHRLGQTRPVKVANFALAGSIDDYVLNLLYQKIDLFTMTIGALETVLADVREGELDVEQRILDLLLSGEDHDAISSGMTALENEMRKALDNVHAAETLTTEVLG